MAEHTPGPWYWDSTDNSVVSVCPNTGAVTTIVAGVRPEDGWRIARACNAYDDLLAACKKAHQAIQGQIDAGGPISMRLNRVRGDLVVAIAEAEGREGGE